MMTNTNPEDYDILNNHPLFMDGIPENETQANTLRAFAALSVGLIPTDTIPYDSTTTDKNSTNITNTTDQRERNNESILCNSNNINQNVSNNNQTTNDTIKYIPIRSHISSAHQQMKERIALRKSLTPYSRGLLSGKKQVPRGRAPRSSAIIEAEKAIEQKKNVTFIENNPLIMKNEYNSDTKTNHDTPDILTMSDITMKSATTETVIAKTTVTNIETGPESQSQYKELVQDAETNIMLKLWSF